MTNEIKTQKAHVLMRSAWLVGDGLLLPKLYIVGKNHYWFLNVARRAAYGTKKRIEVLHIEEAWEIVNGTKWTIACKKSVDWHFDQKGETFKGFLFCDSDAKPEHILAEE